MIVIPSESRGIPRRYLKACATGFLDFARNDNRSQRAPKRIPPLALFTVMPGGDSRDPADGGFKLAN